MVLPEKVAVVIPTYKEKLSELEKISLTQCRRVLNKYPLIFVAPEGRNLPYLEAGNMLVQFNPKFFQSTITYSQLMMSPFFYKQFLNFDYILIYQLDAFVFYDALKDFCALGYDYIGAPWPFHARLTLADKKNIRIGNGGFSLRKVKACYDLLTKNSNLVAQMTGVVEDSFFGYCGVKENINFSVPPISISDKFSIEYSLKHALKNNRKLPFGCHGWTKMSRDFYVELFLQFGYDLHPYLSSMASEDYDANLLRTHLLNFAFQKLYHRIRFGLPLLRYLPRNNFASIHVIRSSLAIMILARLLLEKSSLSDKIFLYEPDEQDILIQNLTLQKLPQLIINFTNWDHDVNLISALNEKGLGGVGLTYGSRVISFRREYLNYCEIIFHKLGK